MPHICLHWGWALASIISIASFGNAMAADMAVKARPMPPPAAAVYDWTGRYVGGNVGYGWGANTYPGITAVDPGNQSGIGPFLTTGLVPGISGNFYPNLNPFGVFGGAQAGYDRQFGSWVLGASDFKDNRLVSTPTTTCCNADESLSAKIDWFGTVRGKIGFAANDWLFYGTGGLAYGDVKSNIGFFVRPVVSAVLPLRSALPAAQPRSRPDGPQVLASLRRGATGTSESNISTSILAVRQ